MASKDILRIVSAEGEGQKVEFKAMNTDIHRLEPDFDLSIDESSILIHRGEAGNGSDKPKICLVDRSTNGHRVKRMEEDYV